MKYWERFLNWANENNVEITWYFLGFMVCDLLVKIGKNDWIGTAWNSAIIVLLYITRKIRM